jgi:hypothetical protein
MESTGIEMMNRTMPGIQFLLIVRLIQMKSSKVIHLLGDIIRDFMSNKRLLGIASRGNGTWFLIDDINDPGSQNWIENVQLIKA